MRIFGGDRVKAIMERLKLPEGEAIEAGIVSRSLESSQRKVEARNFDIRKQLLEYDDVANDQRKVTYAQRNDILDAQNVSDQIRGLRQSAAEDLVHQFVPPESVEEQWDLVGLEKSLASEWEVNVELVKLLDTEKSLTAEDIVERVVKAADAAYDAKLAPINDRDAFANFERVVLLHSIDTHWREHLAALDYLRQGIHLRGYAQKNPKQEYKREAFELFRTLLDTIKNEVTRIMLTVHIQTPEQAEQAASAFGEAPLQDVQYKHAEYDDLEEVAAGDAGTDEAPLGSTQPASGTPRQRPQVNVLPKVGRNDPCPCGSGKKYKHCHGKLD
jgi:preprotein translocase subunit SecA